MVFFQVSPSVVTSSLGDEFLALDASSNVCHILNTTAAWLLKIGGERISVDRTVEMIREQFDIPPDSDIQQELNTCLLDMQSKELVILMCE